MKFHILGRTLFLAFVVAVGGAPNLAAADEAANRVSAQENFRWYCIQCHGPTGDGKGVNNTEKLPVSPRNLTDGKDMAQFSDEDMVRTITRGGGASDLSPIMPPWGNVFTKQEIHDLVALIRKMCDCHFDPKAKEAFLKQEGR